MSRNNRLKKSGVRRLAKAGPSKPSKNAESTPATGSARQEKQGGAPTPTVPQTIDSSDATPSTSCEQEGDDEKKKPKWNWMTIFTGILVGVGIATCLIMVYQNYLTGAAVNAALEANSIARDGMDRSHRARIGHVDIVVSSEIQAGKTIKAVIGFRNFGHDAAKFVRHDADLRVNPVQPDDTAPTLGSVSKAVCERVSKMKGGAIVYPSESVAYNFEFVRDINGNIEGIKSGLEVLSFEGCSVYETMGEQKQSWFCFYWTRDEKKPINEWGWRFCPYGNDSN